MGGTPFSRVKFNARETALSSDEVRAERLMLRELQNVMALGSADENGTPFSCALSALSLASAAGFTMTLADGDAFFYYPTDPGLTVDDSAFQVLRWRAVAALTFATPDATNPRIDLVVAQPASVDADLVSRNILLDPVARTISAQNVFKTTNPAATITVVTGTPGATPAPPAVPAGKVALFEVWVPAAAASSATFSPVQRLFRRAGYPWSIASGLVSGLNPTWDLNVDFSTTASTLTINGIVHKVVIDGEVVSFVRLTSMPVSQDSTANPFGSVTGASDRPYYLYAVGGRHSPQGTFSGGTFSPVAVVESTVAPDLDNYGRPSAPITTPRGGTTQLGAVYVGLGFVVGGGTTRRRACVMDGDMTFMVGSDIGGVLAVTKTGAGIEALGTLGSRPSVSQKVYGRLLLTSAAISSLVLLADRGDGSGAYPNASATLTYASPRVRSAVAAVSAEGNVTFQFNPANPKIWFGGSSLATSDSIGFNAAGYDHRVTRLAAQV